MFQYGDGTPLNPYQIWTAEDLNNVRNYLTSCFVQKADIDLSSYTNFIPIGNSSSPFTGIYNGNNYKIKNLKLNYPQDRHIGLFGSVIDGKISNITVENASVAGDRYIGVIVGFLKNGSITNCKVFNSTVRGNGAMGGICGDIYNPSYSLEVYIKDCTAKGITIDLFDPLYGGYDIGGIVGFCDHASIYNCHFEGNINKLEYDSVRACGGITGSIYSEKRIYQAKINKCSFNGRIYGRYSIGGITGEVSGNTLISECKAEGVVYGGNQIGGINGISFFEIDSGYVYSKISSCCFKGEIYAAYSAGGINGKGSLDLLSDCYVHAIIYAKAYRTETWYFELLSGIGSGSPATITNCYTDVNIINSGERYFDPYSAQPISLNSMINSYYNSEKYTVVGGSINSKSLPRTKAQLGTLSNYTNWDFVNIWRLNSSKNNALPSLSFEVFKGFEWTYPKVSGEPFIVSAEEWNRFTAEINIKRAEKGLPQYGLLDVNDTSTPQKWSNLPSSRYTASNFPYQLILRGITYNTCELLLSRSKFYYKYIAPNVYGIYSEAPIYVDILDGTTWYYSDFRNSNVLYDIVTTIRYIEQANNDIYTDNTYKEVAFKKTTDSLSNYFTIAYTGMDFKATIFNQPIWALDELHDYWGEGAGLPWLQEQGNDIYADYFDYLKNTLNSIV